MKKIRAGLYQAKFQIDDTYSVWYYAERNNGDFNNPAGSWNITSRIVRGNEIVFSDVDTNFYDTLKNCKSVINQMASNWKYTNDLGWCYVGT